MSSTQSVAVAEDVVERQVPPGRRGEILEYLKLFGYKPDSTIIQVHITGFFNKKGGTKKEAEKRQAAAKRYGGTTFVVVGRTHDPSIARQAIKPRKNARDASPGYVGHLWKGKDPQGRAPHEVMPLDFVPAQISYPKDWKDMFATKGLLLAMHVHSSFAAKKGALTRALYRAGKKADAKQKWDFLAGLKSLGYVD